MSDDDMNPEFEKTQKNVSLPQHYANALERMAESKYGNKRAQAQVIMDLIDMTQYRPYTQTVEAYLRPDTDERFPLTDEAKETLDGASGRTHTDSQNIVSDENDGREEDEQNSVSIESMKGVQSVDKAKVVIDHLRDEGTESISRDELIGLITSKAGYSKSGGRNIADEVESKLYRIDTDGLDDWADEETSYDAENEKRLVRKSSKTRQQYEDMGFAAYAAIAPDHVPEDEYYLTEDALGDAVVELFARMATARVQPKRRKKAMVEMLDRIPDDVPEDDVETMAAEAEKVEEGLGGVVQARLQ